MCLALAALLAVALMSFNNEPETRFADVKQVLEAARARVRARLPPLP
jgi:hypothetical protein